jgi:hypothetical protein
MPTVCLTANTLAYPEGGGHQWVFLNWALGLRACGCDVIWLELVSPKHSADRVRAWAQILAERLSRFDITALALAHPSGEPLRGDVLGDNIDLASAACETDLLLNPLAPTRPEIVKCFRRTALVDIDPGLLQSAMATGQLQVPPHDVYFTTGETVGQPGGPVADAGVEWHYTPPCVALREWPVTPAAPGGAFTTVTQWYMETWVVGPGECYRNDKREGFLPFLDLPRRTLQPLELAMPPQGIPEEIDELRMRGWRVRDSYEVAASPWDYRLYIQRSRGEFSCAKPSCVRQQNAWISDRTLCYLASGRPAIVQHTGPSHFLPDREGLLRFRTIDEAAECLNAAADDYERHSRLARALSEEYFDAEQVVGRVVERALA